MAAGTRLFKHGNDWAYDFKGVPLSFHFDHDGNTSWRSLGILPGQMLEFQTDLSGHLEMVRVGATGEVLAEIIIPPNHAINMSLVVGKPLR